MTPKSWSISLKQCNQLLLYSCSTSIHNACPLQIYPSYPSVTPGSTTGTPTLHTLPDSRVAPQTHLRNPSTPAMSQPLASSSEATSTVDLSKINWSLMESARGTWSVSAASNASSESSKSTWASAEKHPEEFEQKVEILKA